MKRASQKREVNSGPNKQDDAPAKRKPLSSRKLGYLIIGVVAVIVVAVIGVFYYQSYVAPFKRVIITVDKVQIRMDYFLDRSRLANATTARDMMQPLTNEILIAAGAPQFGITVTPQDVDQELRRMAAGGSGTVSEAAFKEWYRQQLNQLQVSDTLYRTVIKNSLLTARVEEYLVAQMPTVVPQVRVSVIFVNTEDEANKVIARWNAGENFAKLAAELSTDTDTKDKGGDLGWMPKGVATFDADAFSLDVGQISKPHPYVTDSQSPPSFYYVLMVTDKSAARQVDDQYIQALKDNVLSDWLDTQMTQHQIHWNLNSDTFAWLNAQMAKNSPPASPSSTPNANQLGGQ